MAVDALGPQAVAPGPPDALVPQAVAPGPPESEPAPRSKQRGKNVDSTPEASQWAPPPGCSIGYSKVTDKAGGTVTAWQAKLPVGASWPVPHGHRPKGQNTFYAQFDQSTFGQPLQQPEVRRLNDMPLNDLLYMRKMVSAGTKASLSSAEARAMCSRWLWHYQDSAR